jgi:hypothetical protein
VDFFLDGNLASRGVTDITCVPPDKPSRLDRSGVDSLVNTGIVLTESRRYFRNVTVYDSIVNYRSVCDSYGRIIFRSILYYSFMYCMIVVCL